MTTLSIGMTDRDPVYGWADTRPVHHHCNTVADAREHVSECIVALDYAQDRVVELREKGALDAVICEAISHTRRCEADLAKAQNDYDYVYNREYSRKTQFLMEEK